MAGLLTDDVWEQLDPDAGRLHRRTVARLKRVGVILAAGILVSALGWWSGVTTPRVQWPEHAGYGFSGGPGDPVAHDIPMVNAGLLPVRIVGIGRSGPGLRLTAVTTGSYPAVPVTLPTTLEPGARLTVTVTFEVTDCAKVPVGAWPVPVRVQRSWGTQTAYVSVPTRTSREEPSGTREYEGEDPDEIEWQKEIADLVCDPQV